MPPPFDGSREGADEACRRCALSHRDASPASIDSDGHVYCEDIFGNPWVSNLTIRHWITENDVEKGLQRPTVCSLSGTASRSRRPVSVIVIAEKSMQPTEASVRAREHQRPASMALRRHPVRHRSVTPVAVRPSLWHSTSTAMASSRPRDYRCLCISTSMQMVRKNGSRGSVQRTVMDSSGWM